MITQELLKIAEDMGYYFGDAGGLVDVRDKDGNWVCFAHTLAKHIEKLKQEDTP